MRLLVAKEFHWSPQCLRAALALSALIPGASPPHPVQHQRWGLGWISTGTKTCNLGCKGAYVPRDQEPAGVVSAKVAAQGCHPPTRVPWHFSSPLKQPFSVPGRN